MASVPRRRAPLRIVVAEDHDELRRRMADEIDAQPDMRCVACVAAAEQVVRTAREAGADVVVLDLMLEGGNALHLIREVKFALPASRVIVHSGYSGDVLAGEARRRGASGYVTKSGAVDALLLEIREACYAAPGLRGLAG
jgi:DNA-binding NarL/FixJ family response regulator